MNDLSLAREVCCMLIYLDLCTNSIENGRGPVSTPVEDFSLFNQPFPFFIISSHQTSIIMMM